MNNNRNLLVYLLLFFYFRLTWQMWLVLNLIIMIRKSSLHKFDRGQKLHGFQAQIQPACRWKQLLHVASILRVSLTTGHIKKFIGLIHPTTVSMLWTLMVQILLWLLELNALALLLLILVMGKNNFVFSFLLSFILLLIIYHHK